VLSLLSSAMYFTSPRVSAAALTCPDQFQEDSCQSLCRSFSTPDAKCFEGTNRCDPTNGCLDCFCFCGDGDDFFAGEICG